MWRSRILSNFRAAKAFSGFVLLFCFSLMHNVFSLARPTLLLRLAALLLVSAPILSACDSKGSLAEQTQKIIDTQKVTDDATIQAYLTRHSYTGSDYSRTASGLYLIPVEKGPDTNPLIKTGQKVTVKYVGKFISEANDGRIFDNSSTNRTACGCFSLTAGAGGVIGGWEEALLLMRKGDRKLLLVPSYLAYGQSGSPVSRNPITGASEQNIPANTPLLFDIEVTDVK
jgi:FKBP-type peptidyl-prolyl cis-trans isomerase